MTNWARGDVAMVRLDDETEVRATRTANDDWVTPNGTRYDPALTARPLVVLDPEKAATVNDLARALNDQLPTFVAPAAIQAALRSLVTPPRPAEPTGLGAVVEDDEGQRWVRLYDDDRTYVGAWVEVDTNGPARLWNSIDPVRVLSEGI